jgi:hypothetical protein
MFWIDFRPRKLIANITSTVKKKDHPMVIRMEFPNCAATQLNESY